MHSALKTASSCPDRQPKAVHFADTMGLDLVSVRSILPRSYAPDGEDIFASLPPAFVFRPESVAQLYRLHFLFLQTEQRCLDDTRVVSSSVQARYLHPHFDCGTCNDTAKTKAIVDGARRDGVRLKYVGVMGMTVTGVIAVSNIAYEKQVRLLLLLLCCHMNCR